MQRKRLFTIGEISKIKGITKKALRFYESIDLLKPYYIDPENKYRYYSIEQFIYIDIIKALRLMEISPIEIKAVFKNKDTNELMKFLDQQKEKTIQKIDELRKTIRSIDEVQNTISHSLSSVSHRDVYTRKISQRSIITLAFNRIMNSEDTILEFSQFDQLIEEHRLINTYETGILYKSTEKGFCPYLLFNTVDMDENSDSSRTSTLPAGNYICVCLNKENASEQASKISRYCEENGLEPILVLQVELLNDVFSTDSNYAELQMLV